jgi:chromosome segregation ATPase
MIIEIVIGVVVLVAIGAAVSPKFRATLQIWNTKANNAATTKTDRNRHDLAKLNAEVQAQLNNVASVQASAEIAERDLTQANTDLEKLKKQATSFAAQLSDAGKEDLGKKLVAAKAKVASKTQSAALAHQAAEVALKALQTARENLQQVADSVEEGATKEQVTATLKTAAKIAQDTSNFNNKLGEFNQRNTEIDHDYVAAQKALDLAQNGGDKGAQELAEMQRKADAAAALNEALGTPAAPADKK